MRRFEIKDGCSNKFWEITLHEDSYFVQYGGIGTMGQSTYKSFRDDAMAKRKADAEIKRRILNGYAEISQADLATEDDVAARLVLADTLFANDDLTWCFKCEWKLGFWDKVSIYIDHDIYDDIGDESLETGALLKEALQHPSGQHLRELQCGDGLFDWQPYIDIIAEVGAPELQKLELTDSFSSKPSGSIGDLGPMWKALPKLEYLGLRGDMNLGETEAPKLSTLHVQSQAMSRDAVTSIGKAMADGKMPELQHLELWFGASCDWDLEGDADNVRQTILNAPKSPKLAWLGLMNALMADELCQVVHSGTILKQLTTLNMSMGAMTDRGAEVLLQHAEAFAHLEEFDVSDNNLSPEMCRRLHEAMPNVFTGSQNAVRDEYYADVSE
ncbi:MAG: WGR domain-containing protein [Proteobacteria bacterium]|nr:WGR domain-containing protein [Pseudomonadota bacterium]